MNDTASNARNIVPVVAGFEAGLVVVALGLGWLFGVKPLETLAWDPQAIAWGLAATVPMLLGLWLSVRYPVWPFDGLLAAVDEFLNQVMHGTTLSQFALISLTAGIGEEALFRGFVQTLAQSWTGSTLAGLLLASILFGLFHSVSLAYVVVAGVVGFYFGLLWLQTDNLLAPITAHAAYDLVAIWYIRKTGAGRPGCPESPPKDG